jgi:hypothetical protein
MTGLLNVHPEVRSISYLWAIVAVAFLISTAAPVLSQEAEPTIGHELADSYFEEARSLDAANPWPGTLYGPLMFVDPATRYVVANRADSHGILRAAGAVFAGRLPDDIPVANTAVAWAGRQWTMLVWPPPTGYFGRRVLLGHELFHRLGPEFGIPMASPANEHLDTGSGRLWFRLELRALSRALAADADARRDALSDALAFRAARFEDEPQAAAEERALELNEGLAEYTGIYVALPPGARVGWAVRQLESHGVRAERDGVTRNFAYAIGPAYGLLLDDAMPGWTENVDEQTDLALLVASAYGLEPAASAPVSRARERMDAYGGADIERFELAREADHRRQQAEFRDRFVDGPVLILPADDEFRYSFSPNDVATLEGVGQVFTTSRVRGSWGEMDVSGGVLMRRSEGGITAAVVPAPTDSRAHPITGVGYALTLDEAWELVPGERDGDLTIRPRR